MIKQNAVRSKSTKLKWHKFFTLQKREIKMQQKLNVLQYFTHHIVVILNTVN